MDDDIFPENPLSTYAPPKWPETLSRDFLSFGATYYDTTPTGIEAITKRRAAATQIASQLLSHYCPPRVGFMLHIDCAGSLSATTRLHKTIKNWSAAVLHLDNGTPIHIIFNTITDRTGLATSRLSSKEDRAFMRHPERWGGLPMRLLPTNPRSGKIQRIMIAGEEVIRALVVVVVGNSFEFYTFDKETGPRDKIEPWFGGGVAVPVVRGGEEAPTNVLVADEEDMRPIDAYFEAYLEMMAMI